MASERLPFSTHESIKRCVRLLALALAETTGRPVADVARTLGFSERQRLRLQELFGGFVPEKAELLLREISEKNSPGRACDVVDAAIVRIRCTEAGMDEIDDEPELDPGNGPDARGFHLPSPTLAQIARYFLDSYGPRRLYFHITPFDGQDRMVNQSTFALDNIEQLEPWLLIQTAKIVSGAVCVVAMIVRVFDLERAVDVLGPNGRVQLPEKELYMFRYSGEGSIGFDGTTTYELHCTNPQTGEIEPPEPGVRFASGADVVKALRFKVL